MSKQIMLHGFITQQMIKDDFKYYGNTGDLVRRKSNKLVNKVRRDDQYSKCRVRKMQCQVHQVIFLGVHGYVPEIVDHINGDCGDNRITNLRASDRFHNQWNVSRPGIHLTKNGTWRVQKQIKKRTISFGTFSSREEAEAIALEIQEQLLDGVIDIDKL